MELAIDNGENHQNQDRDNGDSDHPIRSHPAISLSANDILPEEI
jgi:hypothetical protein